MTLWRDALRIASWLRLRLPAGLLCRLSCLGGHATSPRLTLLLKPARHTVLRPQAIEALLRTGGRLPLNVKVMLEGEEEVGSPHLDAFLTAHAQLLACDFVLSADGGQISESQPSLSLGLRWEGAAWRWWA